MESLGPTPSRSHSTGGPKGHRQTVSWEGQPFSGAEGKNHSTSPQSQRGPVRLVTVVLCCIYLPRPEVSSLFYLMICIVIFCMLLYLKTWPLVWSCWKNILCHKTFLWFLSCRFSIVNNSNSKIVALCSIVSYRLKNITCVCSSEKTTSYRRTSSGSQGKSSAPSPGCAGSQEELYCSPVGGAPSPAPPPVNANNSATVPIILPPPRSRKNAMVTCHIMIFYFEICFFKCLHDD